MDIEKKELWDRLENEPERAFRAFQGFLSLPGAARTVIAAYRRHTGNPEAVKPSDTWSRWASQFAWRERAAAWDRHIDQIRRGEIEKAVAKEAERQATAAAKNYFKLQEITTVSYDRVYEWFDSTEWDESRLRASDAMAFLKLFTDITFRQMEIEKAEQKEDFEWTEEDDAALSDIVDFVESAKVEEVPEEDSEEGHTLWHDAGHFGSFCAHPAAWGPAELQGRL